MPKSKVAAYLANHIDASPKTQYQIAAEAGFDRPNVISMFKTGMTKLPIGRVIPMAKAIDADPVELFRLCMNEYSPDVLAVTDEIYKRDRLTSGETELIKRIRLQTKGRNFKISKVASDIDELAKELARPTATA